MGKVVEALRRELDARGYTLLEGPVDPGQAIDILSASARWSCSPTEHWPTRLGLAQGFEKLHHTKSPNTIQVHTEAPGWRVPPRYLALYCHVQAACGGGQTELADMHAFIAGLGDGLRHLAYEREIDWPSYASKDPENTGVHRPIIERTAQRQIIRMSYNLLKTGACAPTVDEPPSLELLTLGAEGADLAERVIEFFRLSKMSVLILESTILLWNNQRMLHARSAYRDLRWHLTCYWLAEPVASEH